MVKKITLLHLSQVPELNYKHKLDFWTLLHVVLLVKWAQNKKKGMHMLVQIQKSL